MLADATLPFTEFLFLFLHISTCCGYTLELPCGGSSHECHNKWKLLLSMASVYIKSKGPCQPAYPNIFVRLFLQEVLIGGSKPVLLSETPFCMAGLNIEIFLFSACKWSFSGQYNMCFDGELIHLSWYHAYLCYGKTYGKCPKILNSLFPTFFGLFFVFNAVVFKYLVEWQTVETLIRLLLKEQSDLGLHCLHMPFCQPLWCMKFQDTYRMWTNNLTNKPVNLCCSILALSQFDAQHAERTVKFIQSAHLNNLTRHMSWPGTCLFVDTFYIIHWFCKQVAKV